MARCSKAGIRPSYQYSPLRLLGGGAKKKISQNRAKALNKHLNKADDDSSIPPDANYGKNISIANTLICLSYLEIKSLDKWEFEDFVMLESQAHNLYTKIKSIENVPLGLDQISIILQKEFYEKHEFKVNIIVEVCSHLSLVSFMEMVKDAPIDTFIITANKLYFGLFISNIERENYILFSSGPDPTDNINKTHFSSVETLLQFINDRLNEHNPQIIIYPIEMEFLDTYSEPSLNSFSQSSKSIQRTKNPSKDTLRIRYKSGLKHQATKANRLEKTKEYFKNYYDNISEGMKSKRIQCKSARRQIIVENLGEEELEIYRIAEGS